MHDPLRVSNAAGIRGREEADTRYYYLEINKAEKQSDGTLMVEGVGSSERPDASNQIMDYESLKAGIPEFMQWHNLREMHQAIAAGNIEKCEPDDSSKSVAIRAHVIDPTTIFKVQTGVLKGISVGVKVARIVSDAVASGGRIITKYIKEFSLVDRPCNSDAMFCIVKREEAPDGGKSFSSISQISGLVDAALAAANMEEFSQPAHAKLKFKTDDIVRQLNEVLTEFSTSEVEQNTGTIESKAMDAKSKQEEKVMPEEIKTDAKVDETKAVKEGCTKCKAFAEYHKEMGDTLAAHKGNIGEEAMKAFGAAHAKAAAALDAKEDEAKALADAAKAADLKKSAADSNAALEEMKKVLGLAQTELAAKEADLVKANAEIEVLKAKAAPAKAVLKDVKPVVVEKTVDGNHAGDANVSADLDKALKAADAGDAKSVLAGIYNRQWGAAARVDLGKLPVSSGEK